MNNSNEQITPVIDRNAKIIKLKLDIIFKRIFGDSKNERIIKAFLSALLEIPKESIKSLTIENVELPPEYADQKFSKLDLKLNVNDKIVDVEMQINRVPGFSERSLYYGAKLYSKQLKSGDDYEKLNQTICINITSFKAFNCEDYHSCFKMIEHKRHEVLTEKFIIHFFELSKINKCNKNKPMDDWLKLINAETEGELMDIQTTTLIPEIQETIVHLRTLNGDEKIRREAELREKRLHDEASSIKGAWREGKAEGIQEGIEKGIQKNKYTTATSLIQMGLLSYENISIATGLTIEEIENLAYKLQSEN